MWTGRTQEHDKGQPGGPEPIAIVGMGCRFPGGITSPQEYWDFMVAGRDSVRTVPPLRWESYLAESPEQARAVRKAITLGSYLDDIEGFDAEFFGIAPREAELMDPQQRMTLEVAWEALEHAGIVPGELAGTDTSVFMGVCSDDYGRRMLEDLPRLEAWMGIGSSLCGIPNRVSYALDLRGPSVAVDTACSASLVAIHQACQALRLGETSLAIAGGVMLVASPSFALVLEAAGALSPDGRSKAFDASANGYGRGEGCGVLVLKRLSDAHHDNDRVLAVVRGSVVAQDGRTVGIMAPSMEAQEHMVRQACVVAGIEPSTVDYVEAHGTGTGLGDPIEVGSLAAVVGVDRADQPCLIGSVKTNIGHLEAASGVAGVIKSVLAMNHGEIPATLSATELNPNIPWAESGLSVVTENTPWPTTDHPKRAGIGNYGYGGTIAHVIVEQAPPVDRPRELAAGSAATSLRVYPLSGGTADGVRENAATAAKWLADNPSASLDSIGHTLAHRRAALDTRASVVASGREELAERLAQLAAGRPATGVSTGRTVRGAASQDAVWVFSGHGAQWSGMGRELIDSEPLLGQTLDELEPVYLEELGFSPRQALLDGDLEDVDKAQAMIFAMQVGLARIWHSYGLRPAAIIGHSVGEIAAAVAAGLLDLSDASRLICRRSRLLRQVAGLGTMAMVNLPFGDAAARLTGRVDVTAAIVASPSSTVISGTVAAVEAVVEQWQADGLVVRRVNSDVAFHSAAMDVLLADLVAELAELTPRQAGVPVYSTALEDPRANPPRDASYWAVNLRNPVRFAGAVTAAVEDGHRVFLEVSTHPVVAHSITETLAAAGVSGGVVVPTLRRERPERETLLDNLGLLHCHGVPVDWAALQPAGELVDLPTMAWQHRRYWVDPSPAAAAQRQLQHDVEGHTLLGPRTAVQGVAPVSLWQTYLDNSNRPYPGGHAVLGAEVIPAAVTLSTFLAAAEFRGMAKVSLRVPIAVTTPRELQVVSQNDRLRLSSRLAGDVADQAWLTHADADIVDVPAEPQRLDLPALRDICTTVEDPGCVMERLIEIGVVGIGFPWRVEEVRRSEDSMLARIVSDPDGVMGTNTWGSLLDAALSAAPIIFPGDPWLRMPGDFREVTVFGEAPSEVWASIHLIEGSPDGVEVDIEVATLDGELAARLTGVRFGAVQKDVLIELGPDPVPGAGDRTWLDLRGNELREHLVGIVQEVAATEIRVDPTHLDLHRPLAEMGVDSLMTMGILARLEQRFRVPLPSTLLWSRPTVAAVADHLAEVFTAQALEAAEAAEEAEVAEVPLAEAA